MKFNSEYRRVPDMRQQRLIYDQPTGDQHRSNENTEQVTSNGAWNMAVDEAILMAVAAGDSPPTLRLYSWDPPCLSLGYGQHWYDADLDRLNTFGWDIVRRPTGGRAILHIDELTYSLMIPEGHPLAKGDIIESYRRISTGLMAMLDTLGLRARSERKQEGHPPGHTHAVCFETPSHYEITTPRGHKLIGSAQLRRRGGVLQHGSLPLQGDIARICDALVFETEAEREAAKTQVHRRATTLANAFGGHFFNWEQVANVLIEAFQSCLDMELTLGTLTDAERAHAEYLAEGVYGTEEWTKRR